MRAINHAMTGALIGLAIANPVALPLAFASHYALDAIPHHGDNKQSFKSKLFKGVLLIDVLLCISLAIVVGAKHPHYWPIVILCAFLAASPDFMWFSDFLRTQRGQSRKELTHRNAIVRWHGRIQWFQQPLGIIVELAWALMTGTFLFYMLWR